jgi:hypothetical protein
VDPAILSVLLEWQEAEQRLSGLAFSRPHSYEASLRAVRAVADELEPVRAVDELVALHGERTALAERVVRREGLPLGDVVPAQVAGAAFAIRYREIRAADARADVARRIGEARASGATWVVLHEEGIPSVGTPQPYRRVEMHLPDGRGFTAFVDEDPDSGEPRFGVELLTLDPGTGRAATPPTDRRTFSDTREWERHVEDVRRRIGSP